MGERKYPFAAEPPPASAAASRPGAGLEGGFPVCLRACRHIVSRRGCSSRARPSRQEEQGEDAQVYDRICHGRSGLRCTRFDESSRSVRTLASRHILPSIVIAHLGGTRHPSLQEDEVLGHGVELEPGWHCGQIRVPYHSLSQSVCRLQ